MGRSQRPRPTRLASKLLQIRLGLGLTQQKMIERLDYRQSPLLLTRISDFELDKREPPLPLLLAYARTAGVSLDMLADDERDLPPGFSSMARPPRAKRDTSPPRCPHCAATGKQTKAGRNRSGSTRYQCRSCLRHHTPRPTKNRRRGKPAGLPLSGAIVAAP